MARKKNDGWIKLHRTLRKNCLWQAQEPFDRRSAWIDLLLMVNHEERALILRNGKTIIVEPGQAFVSYEHLRERWHWGSRDRVKRYFKLLADHDMITVTSTPNGTLICLKNWAKFQSGSTANATRTSQQASQQTSQQASHEQEVYKNIYNNKNVIKNKREGASDSSFEDEFE